MRILVTGSSGFVGNVFVDRALEKSVNINLAVRAFIDKYESNTNQFLIHGLSKTQDWQNILVECNVVVHLAARAHIMNDDSIDPLSEFRDINTYGTLNLAKQAASSGVKRFIYISSIKVNGEHTSLDKPFLANDQNIPNDPYGVSKYEAEMGLRKVANDTGMEVVIIRPPLVYGPGVKANFSAMINLVSKGIPLPFGGLNKNKRSLVSLDNLVDLILTCLDHPNAANQTFLVSDNHDLSTADMFKLLSLSCGKSGYLIPFPALLFEKIFKLIGKQDIYQRLGGSLQVDISDTYKKLNWQPPYSVDEGFAKTAKHFLKNKK
jgi:nucleoside-diphosphate-sugar epimerase